MVDFLFDMIRCALCIALRQIGGPGRAASLTRKLQDENVLVRDKAGNVRQLIEGRPAIHAA